VNLVLRTNLANDRGIAILQGICQKSAAEIQAPSPQGNPNFAGWISESLPSCGILHPAIFSLHVSGGIESNKKTPVEVANQS